MIVELNQAGRTAGDLSKEYGLVDCVLPTLKKAKKLYPIPEGMILHTDLGSQYTAIEVSIH